MSAGNVSSTGGGGAPRQPTEEEMRAALEEEMKRITPDDLLIQTLVSLINLAARRLGLVEGSQDEVDLAQAQTAIDGARAIMPVLAARHGDQLGEIQQALTQLQMAFAQAAGGTAAPVPPPGPEGEAPPEPGAPAQEPPKSGDQGPAQSSGRLWVPGQ